MSREPDIGQEDSDHRPRQPAVGALARVLVRRDASHKAVRGIEEFLRENAVADFAFGRVGSARSGYWTTIDLTDRRDLDCLRQVYPRLIDGWMELL